MATKKAAAKAEADAPAPEAPEVTDHGGWAHDWRNQEATFAADDRCANAEMRRLADATR